MFRVRSKDKTVRDTVTQKEKMFVQEYHKIEREFIKKNQEELDLQKAHHKENPRNRQSDSEYQKGELGLLRKYKESLKADLARFSRKSDRPSQKRTKLLRAELTKIQK